SSFCCVSLAVTSDLPCCMPPDARLYGNYSTSYPRTKNREPRTCARMSGLVLVSRFSVLAEGSVSLPIAPLLAACYNRRNDNDGDRAECRLFRELPVAARQQQGACHPLPSRRGHQLNGRQADLTEISIPAMSGPARLR